MRRSAFAASLAALLFSTSTQAVLSDFDPEWDQAMEVPCPALMTAEECLAHKDAMAFLNTDSERNAYLTDLARLLNERKKSCECALLVIDPKR
jgi:hypothetical protein